MHNSQVIYNEAAIAEQLQLVKSLMRDEGAKFDEIRQTKESFEAKLAENNAAIADLDQRYAGLGSRTIAILSDQPEAIVKAFMRWLETDEHRIAKALSNFVSEALQNG